MLVYRCLERASCSVDSELVNYKNWKPGSKNVKALFLDPQNPRIPPGRPLSDSELLEELALHDNVLEIARSISTNGFFPTEPLVVIREDGRLLVVEGNRRLAACKLLDDPSAAPLDQRQRFTTMAATTSSASLRQLPTVLAPSRESTIPLVISRHTSNQLQPWEPAMQAAFYFRLVQRGLSVEEVAKSFGIEASEVRKSLREHSLYQMACRLDLDDETVAIVRNPRRFPLTNLGRIFANPKAREFFGIEFTNSGGVEGKVHEQEFAKAFSRAVKDVATGVQDSRSLDSSDNIQQYVNSFQSEHSPDLSRLGSFTEASFFVSSPRPVPTIAKARKAKSPTRAPVGLIPTSMHCAINNRRVQELFDELKKLSPASGRFPNACAVSFRCFLEVSVYCFLQAKGEITKIRAEYLAEIAAKNARLPSGRPPRVPEPNWSPTLSAMLKRLADPSLGLLPDAQVTKALGKLIKDEELFTLNLLAHNWAYHPTEDRLRSTWKNMEEFFKIILA